MAGTARVERAGWWGGIGSLLLIGAGFFAIDAGGTNGPDAPVDLLVNDIVSTQGRIVTGSIVGVIGAALLIWFASTLRLRLARDGELGSTIGLAAYGAALLMSVGALIHASFRMAMTSVGSLTLAEAMRPLAILGAHSLDVFAWGMIALAVAVIVAAFAVGLDPPVARGGGRVHLRGLVRARPERPRRCPPRPPPVADGGLRGIDLPEPPGPPHGAV